MAADASADGAMKLHRLELENFKSYKGKQIVGAFGLEPSLDRWCGANRHCSSSLGLVDRPRLQTLRYPLVAPRMSRRAVRKRCLCDLGVYGSDAVKCAPVALLTPLM